jgi:hypothetical protein
MYLYLEQLYVPVVTPGMIGITSIKGCERYSLQLLNWNFFLHCRIYRVMLEFPANRGGGKSRMLLLCS